MVTNKLPAYRIVVWLPERQWLSVLAGCAGKVPDGSPRYFRVRTRISGRMRFGIVIVMAIMIGLTSIGVASASANEDPATTTAGCVGGVFQMERAVSGPELWRQRRG